MLHTRFKAESPVLKVGSCRGTQLKVTGLSALQRKPNLDKLAALLRPFFSSVAQAKVLIPRFFRDESCLCATSPARQLSHSAKDSSTACHQRPRSTTKACLPSGSFRFRHGQLGNKK